MADSTRGKNDARGYTLELVGVQPGQERPPIVVQALGAENQVLHSQKIGPDGGFDIPPDVLKKARYIVLGAPQDDGIAADRSVRFRPGEFEAAAANRTLALAEGIWSRFPL